MKTTAILAAALACSALVSTSAAQGVNPQSAAQTATSRPTFRATTEMVALNVTVVDSHEHHVTGLTSGDFAVYDDGVPQDGEDRTLNAIDEDLKRLARESGGQAFFPPRLDELDGVYARVAKELSMEYSLAYVPKRPPLGRASTSSWSR